jgi:hypothetical protein
MVVLEQDRARSRGSMSAPGLLYVWTRMHMMPPGLVEVAIRGVPANTSEQLRKGGEIVGIAFTREARFISSR